MSGPDPSNLSAEAQAPVTAPPSLSVRNVMLLTVPVVLVALGYLGYVRYVESHVPPPRVGDVISYSVMSPTQLDPDLTDRDGDLIADSPNDPAQHLDPDPLVFSLLGNNLEQERAIWKDFCDHLGKQTGKKVELVLQQYATPPALKDLKDGKYHVAALNTGLVSTAVNQGGFVPVCVMANAEGKFGYEMEFIVPKTSPLQSLHDLRGKTVPTGGLRSLSSYKLPIILLWQEHQMLPGRDYEPVFGGGQELLIGSVLKGEYLGAPVAGDLLRRIMARQGVPADAVRTIYKSKRLPPACFGHGYRLKPELAGKVRDAFLGFDWKGTSLEKAYASADQTRFVPVNYKTDWEYIRDIDRAMNELVGQRP